MANLSISTAWAEASAFVTREARLLFPVAFLLVALPAACLQLAMPTPLPGRLPEAGAWLALLPVATIAGMIGSIALNYLALRPGASVGEALQRGARRFIILLAATLLLALGAFAAMIPLVVLAGAGAVLGGARPEAVAGPIMLVPLLLLIGLVALWARLMLMTPVAAAEEAGPIGIIARSWQLTSGHFWKLLGFVLLLLLVFVILSLVVATIGGMIVLLLAGRPDPGSLGAFLIVLVDAAMNMVISVYFAALVARIYAQLAGTGSQNVFA